MLPLADRHRRAVAARSLGRCEATVPLPLPWGTVATQCTLTAAEIHHGLTRARGGDLLEQLADEIYHLFHLCRRHHRMADGAAAYTAGLLIPGRVLEHHGLPIYLGTDPYLTQHYPPPKENTDAQDPHRLPA